MRRMYVPQPLISENAQSPEGDGNTLDQQALGVSVDSENAQSPEGDGNHGCAALYSS